MHIVVYAGPPKSASTTLQVALWRNRESLARAAIDYVSTSEPDGWIEWGLVSLYAGPAELASSGLFPTAEAQRSWSEKNWTDLEARLDQSTADVALISSEHFCFVRDRAALVARLRRRADRLSFVAYARDPVALYASGIDEMVRGGDVFAKLPKPADFHHPLESIRAYDPFLPDDGLVIRSFEPGSLKDGDIVADFFHVLSGIAGRRVTAEVAVKRENESLPGAVTLWLLSTNALGPFDEAALARRSALIEALRADELLKDLPKLRMTDPEIATAIRLSNRPLLDWLNSGPLARSPLETAPAGAMALPAAQLREKLWHWLLSYGRENHMRLVVRAAMRHGRTRSSGAVSP
jgi:hypothetical protein